MIQAEETKLVYDRMDITIAVGDAAFADQKTLRSGECVGVKVVDFSNSSAKAHSINLGIQDTNGNELVAQTDFRDYTPNGGGYIDGFKPVSFKSDGHVKVNATSSQAIAATDFAVQLIFAVRIKK